MGVLINVFAYYLLWQIIIMFSKLLTLIQSRVLLHTPKLTNFGAVMPNLEPSYERLLESYLLLDHRDTAELNLVCDQYHTPLR